jgi:hypothetical protein
LKATRILVDLPAQEEATATASMKKKSNKAYYLQEPEDTETKETLKKAQMRAAEQLRKDTLAQYSRRRLRSSINNRIQQHQRQ